MLVQLWLLGQLQGVLCAQLLLLEWGWAAQGCHSSVKGGLLVWLLLIGWGRLLVWFFCSSYRERLLTQLLLLREGKAT